MYVSPPVSSPGGAGESLPTGGGAGVTSDMAHPGGSRGVKVVFFFRFFLHGFNDVLGVIWDPKSDPRWSQTLLNNLSWASPGAQGTPSGEPF